MNTEKTVLIADDDLFVRELIGEILQETGFTPRYADNGKEALKLFKNSSTNLIITDMHMPEMDGMTLVNEIRKIDADIPIIVLTVNSEISTAVEAIRKGADDYIIKGNTISDTLPIAIAKVMELYELKTENRELILDLSRKNAELERLAFLDALTGISNRGHFDAVLQSEWDRAMNKRQQISMIMTDIDYFKNLNDSLGHKFGDYCLQKVARSLNRALRRTSDFLARYGGDEFAVILPATTIADARIVGERMRDQVTSEQMRDPETNETRSLTMSFGVYTLIPEEGSEPKTLIEGADKALYQAKHLGRDQVFAGDV